MDEKLDSISLNSKEQEQWLDKLWLHLFDANTGGLMTPGQIRREKRNRHHVREAEMSAILEAEREINDIRRGVKALDDYGNLVETPHADTITTHKMIENTGLDDCSGLRLDSPSLMIRAAIKEVSIRALERSLNLKKLAILAESEILEKRVTQVSLRPVNAGWMQYWRESAEIVFHPEMQQLWVRMLVKEIAQPGLYCLGLMTNLHHLSVGDLESVLIAAKYKISDFIYNARESYFNTDFHRELFEEMEEMGLLGVAAIRKMSLSSETKHEYTRVLCCGNKALKVTADNVDQVLELNTIRLSKIGRQLFDLIEADTDLAYLFDLANTIKAQNFNVVLGDRVVDPLGRPLFVEKMQL